MLSGSDKIEKDLMQLFSKKDWFKLTYLLIDHGRSLCMARNPNCQDCFLNKICPSAFKV
jgi:endonuclease III